jgi:hypothetical protein
VKRWFLLFVCLLGASEALAAQQKKDLRALFSFRREKFTENEARSQDFGFDVLLSTLFPVSPLVKSIEQVGGPAAPLNYATFLNFEGSAFMSFNYHWQVYVSSGMYTYDTRKENAASQPTLPQFHQFSMSAIPVMAGVKYRFGTTDIVPYVGVGGGIAFGDRRASYDYNNVNFREESFTAITGQLLGGFEFYISPRAGIRLEAAAFYMKVPSGGYSAGNAPSALPFFQFEGSILSMRYASGLFFLL